MDKKNRIAMVIDVYDNKSGANVSTKRFTNLLRDNGYSVKVLTTGKKEKDRIVLKRYYPPFGKKIMQSLDMNFALPDEKKMKAVFKKVDVVHVQVPSYLGFKAIKYARELGLPVVMSFHVQAENITQNMKMNSKLFVKLIYKLFLKYFYNKADVIVCPSVFAKQELQRFGLKTPAVVVSNGYSKYFHPIDVKREKPKKFVLLTVGRLTREKNHETIIDAIEMSKHKDDIKLVVVGNGPLKKKLKKYACVLNDVEFLGFVSDEDLLKWYNSADVYVHSGLVELESMTALEAMACGLPILVSDSSKSATKQFALTDKSKFSDAKDLAKKIDYWYEHPKELANAKKEYLKSVKKYDIHISLKKMEDVYRMSIKYNSEKNGKKTNI